MDKSKVLICGNEKNFFKTKTNFYYVGFNDDVLKSLIKFYLIKPIEPQVKMRPYLSHELYIGNVSDTERRQKGEKNFKFLFSNRPSHILKDEIYHWEKIYKVYLNEGCFLIAFKIRFNYFCIFFF